MQNKVATIYVRRGFKDRRDYLNSLAEEYGVDIEIVLSLAEVLGESEDFDGLVSELKYSPFI